MATNTSSDSTKDVRARIEAALYASGRALDAEQLANAAGISSKKRAVEEAKAVAAIMKSALSALEVVEYPGPRFAMQLKADYTSIARKFATKPLLSKAALRTEGISRRAAPSLPKQLMHRNRMTPAASNGLNPTSSAPRWELSTAKSMI